MTDENKEIAKSNILPLYPKGLPKEAQQRLQKLFGERKVEDVVVLNPMSGRMSNLAAEREHLHKTLDDAIGALYSMSVMEKHQTFVGVVETAKTCFDLYIQAMTRNTLAQPQI